MHEWRGKLRAVPELARMHPYRPSCGWIRNQLAMGVPVDYVMDSFPGRTFTYQGGEWTLEELHELRADRSLTVLGLKTRLYRGWSVERALAQPCRR